MLSLAVRYIIVVSISSNVDIFNNVTIWRGLQTLFHSIGIIKNTHDLKMSVAKHIMKTKNVIRKYCFFLVKCDLSQKLLGSIIKLISFDKDGLLVMELTWEMIRMISTYYYQVLCHFIRTFGKVWPFWIQRVQHKYLSLLIFTATGLSIELPPQEWLC